MNTIPLTILLYLLWAVVGLTISWWVDRSNANPEKVDSWGTVIFVVLFWPVVVIVMMPSLLAMIGTPQDLFDVFERIVFGSDDT